MDSASAPKGDLEVSVVKTYGQGMDGMLGASSVAPDDRDGNVHGFDVLPPNGLCTTGHEPKLDAGCGSGDGTEGRGSGTTQPSGR